MGSLPGRSVRGVPVAVHGLEADGEVGPPFFDRRRVQEVERVRPRVARVIRPLRQEPGPVDSTARPVVIVRFMRCEHGEWALFDPEEKIEEKTFLVSERHLKTKDVFSIRNGVRGWVLKAQRTLSQKTSKPGRPLHAKLAV